tara:strand:+ start:182 stop:1303 length:1122 start_codon:yes stop_codon:yes gene_type:complete
LDPISLTEELVAFDTISCNTNRAMCDRIVSLLEPLGGVVRLQAQADAPEQVNLIARFGPEGAGGLALAGHTDTVPFDDSMRATNVPSREGAKLYGRGTCDMKGAIAAMLDATARIEHSRLKKPLWLLFTFQEEIGCLGAKHLVRAAPVPVEHCIIGEPTGLRPVTRHKGYVTAILKFHGRPCHSSDPDAGASAIHAASRAVDALVSLGEQWKAASAGQGSDLLPPWTTLNVGLFQGGAARNVVPEHAQLSLEIRPMPGLDSKQLLGEAEAVAREAAKSVRGVTLEFHVDDVDTPLDTPEDAEIVRWLIEATGNAASTVPFYTEGPTFQAMGASPCVCGPGEIAQAHRVDEWVELDALMAASDLYRDAISEFCT